MTKTTFVFPSIEMLAAFFKSIPEQPYLIIISLCQITLRNVDNDLLAKAKTYGGGIVSGLLK
jgi:hypothetical protein